MTTLNTRSSAFSGGFARTPKNHNTAGNTTLTVPGSTANETPISYPIIPVVVPSTGIIADFPTYEIVINQDTTEYYTIASSVGKDQCGRWLRFNYAINETNSKWYVMIAEDVPVDMIIMGAQVGNAQIEFIPQINHNPNNNTYSFAYSKANLLTAIGASPRTRGKGSVFGMVCAGSNTWDVFGDLDDAEVGL